ncbi:hypothetical protein GCK72_022605 [Caenorhabditis remanei]|uniref:Uncharacterized protein n=1 Tax=Caenorhabditis remanei TaxID=31234 RepID=A0A6A5FUB5_CAERE|nr:hypothetical protein GCK72_022605 [Caenorhabditis remanei]KAF1746152.1 hypothetical protein GCK72_022605 [Caenorhabditis remanei]
MLDTNTDNVIHGWARQLDTDNILLCTHQLGTRTSPITLVDKRTADSQLLVKTLYRTNVELTFIGDNSFALCPQNGQVKVFDLRFANKQLWSTSAEKALGAVLKIGVTAGKLHTIQDKNGISVFDVTTGEIVHRKVLPPKGHAIGYHSGNASSDLWRAAFKTVALLSTSQTSSHIVLPVQNDLFVTGDSTGKVVMMIADTSINNFADHFITTRDRDKG